ncbi:chaperone required for assembly of F1-ATPase [Erythrobacter lutimaris]|nr:chaperone required for assembly of F1-ATPase [Alteriqipengyuania lutimaris]
MAEATRPDGGRGWQVHLDGRPVKTRLGAPQVVPTEALAELLRREWAQAPQEFDASAFALRDLADRAIDTIESNRDAVIDRLLAFADGDTLCYRAEPDEAVARRQAQVWEPVVAQIEADLAITLNRTHGIIHRPQSEASQTAIRARLEKENVFVLAGLDAASSLAASLCVALSGLRDDADAKALWAAANLEEDYQAEQWGIDEEARARRDAREAEFTRAIEFARAARS